MTHQTEQLLIARDRVPFKLNDTNDKTKLFEIFKDTSTSDIILGKLKWKKRKNKITHLIIKYSSLPKTFLKVNYCSKLNSICIHCTEDSSLSNSSPNKVLKFKLKDCKLNNNEEIAIDLFVYLKNEPLLPDCVYINPSNKPNHRQGNIIVGGY